MAITLKTITGKVVIPGTTTGIRAKVTATPMTNAQALTFPDDNVLTWGPVEGYTDASGMLPATFKIPTSSAQQAELLWKFVAEPVDKHTALPKAWTMGEYQITGSGTIDLADLVDVDVLGINTATYVTIQNYVASATAASQSAAASATSAAASAAAANSLVTADLGTTDAQTWALLNDQSSLSAGVVAARYATPRRKTAVDFNIPTDGVTDATAALNAIPANQGEVELRGIFNVTNTIVPKPGTTLRGTGPRNDAQIVAAPGFAGTALVDLGGGATAHGTRIEHMALVGNGLVAKGVVGSDIQELSGLHDVVISGWTDVGVDLSGGTGTNQNYSLSDIEIYADAAASGLIGLKTEAGAFVQSIRNVTVIGGALGEVAGAGSIGIQLNGPVGLISGLHFESVEAGVQFNGASGSTLIGANGLGGPGVVTDLVQIADTPQDNINLIGLIPNGSTNTLNDLLHTYTYVGTIALFSWGSGGEGGEHIFNLGDPNALPVFRSGVNFGQGGNVYSSALDVLRTNSRWDVGNTIIARVGQDEEMQLGPDVGYPAIVFGSGFDTVIERPAPNILQTGINDVFRTGYAATVSRPDAATVGVGAQFFDATLARPIWSNGSIWVDATGAAI